MLKWLLIGLGVLIALVIAAIAALPWLLDTPAIKSYVTQVAAHSFGRPVRYASLSVSAFPLPAVRLKGFQVAEDPAFGPGPFLTVGEGRIGIRLRPLLSGRVELADLTLDEPRIDLVEDAGGRLNLATLGAPAAPGPVAPRGAGARGGSLPGGGLVFSSVRVVNGSVRYTRRGGKEAAIQLEKINMAMSQGAPGEGLVLRGDAVAQPGGLRLVVAEASLMPGAARPLGEMPLKATVDLEAEDVAPIAAIFLASPVVSGAAKGKLQLAGTPARPTATGMISLDRLTLSELRPQCGGTARRQLVMEAVRLPLTASPTAIDSAPATARVARGSMSLRATVSLHAPAAATLREIAVKAMELGPVLVDFLCQPYAVTGPLDLGGESTLRLADMLKSASGSGRVRIGPGKVVGREIVRLVRDVVGLGTTVSALARPDRPLGSSPLDFDSITGTYTIADGVARTDDLLYRARDVTVRAAGTYALADGRVAMEVTLTQGANQVKGFVAGAPGSLHVVPTGVKLGDTRDLRKFLDRLFR